MMGVSRTTRIKILLIVVIVVGLYLIVARSGMYITDAGMARESVLKTEL